MTLIFNFLVPISCGTSMPLRPNLGQVCVLSPGRRKTDHVTLQTGASTNLVSNPWAVRTSHQHGRCFSFTTLIFPTSKHETLSQKSLLPTSQRKTGFQAKILPNYLPCITKFSIMAFILTYILCF